MPAARAGDRARCSAPAPASGAWARMSTAPIFEGGTLLHQERAAKAAYVQAAQQYRSTVLTAFQNVADTLTALEQDAEGLKAAAAADDAAKVTLDLSERQWKDGYAGYLALLNAEQAYQQAQINLSQAQANRYADTAALFQALGGGWWQRADLPKGLMRTESHCRLLRSSLAAGCHRVCRRLFSQSASNAPDATSTASNVTLTAAQRQNISLYTVAPATFRKTIETTGVGGFRQRSGDQRAGALLRAGVAAAGFARRPRQQGQPLATVIHPTSPRPSAPIARRWSPPHTTRQLADLDKDLLQHQASPSARRSRPNRRRQRRSRPLRRAAGACSLERGSADHQGYRGRPARARIEA